MRQFSTETKAIQSGITMRFSYIFTPFQKDMQGLQRKYKGIWGELEKFANHIAVYSEAGHAPSELRHTKKVDDGVGYAIFRSHMRCSATSGKAFRVIYAHYDMADVVEFIEIFHKASNENKYVDQKRIDAYKEWREESAL